LLSNQTLNGGINIFFAVLVGEYYRTPLLSWISWIFGPIYRLNHWNFRTKGWFFLEFPIFSLLIDKSSKNMVPFVTRISIESIYTKIEQKYIQDISPFFLNT
jgi:hypothetical protein